MEKDPEIKGEGNSYTTEFRQYDPRLGRWLSLDPLMTKFPWMSPYVAFDNNPVLYNDPLGLAAQGGDPLEGKNPIIWGAVKSAFLSGAAEFCLQVADLMIFEGMDLEEAVTRIDYSSLVQEAMKGALKSLIPWDTSLDDKLSKLFTGKYRKMTMYIIKVSVEAIEELVTAAIGDAVTGQKIDLLGTLEDFVGEKVIGEIISAKPIIDKRLKKRKSKIQDQINKANKKIEEINNEIKKINEYTTKSEKEKIEKKINRLNNEKNKHQNKATNILAKEYTHFVGGKKTKELMDRARGQVAKRINKTAKITIGELENNGTSPSKN
jgi:RHS repeat-associated protein